MGNTTTKRIRDALLAKIEERHRADLRAVDRVLELLADDPDLLHELIGGGRGAEGSPSDNGSRAVADTNVVVVTNALRAADAWITAPMLAERTGLAEGAVRTVLYTRKDLFKKKKIGPRKVAWRLASGEKTDGNSAEN